MIAEPIAERKQWTYAEVAQFEDDARVEIHDGALFEMPSPTWNHQHIIGFLYRLLMAWADQNGGVAFVSPIDLYVSERKYYIPDLVFYLQSTLDSQPVTADAKRLRVAPDLIVEVASPSTESNDRTIKVRAYAEFGVPNYWIVDAESQNIQALELHEGRYVIAAACEAGETFAPAVFPGATVEISTLFAFPGQSARTPDAP